jgi:hypothetical protein
MRSGKWGIIVGIVLVASLAAVPMAAGADQGTPRVTAARQINGAGATGEDYFPAIAANTCDREALVVWVDYRAGTSAVWGRLVDVVTGTPIGVDFQIGGAETYDPAAAYSGGADLYLVTFTKWDGALDTDVMAQRVRGDGTLKGDPICISCSAVHQEYASDVAQSTLRGQFLVVWTDESNPTDDILGRRVRPNGNFVGSTIPVATAANGATGDDDGPAVAYNHVKGQFQVVWADARGVLDIYGQRIRDNGNLIGSAFRISTDPSPQWGPDIAFDGYEAEYYVVWSDDRRKSVDVYGQLLSSYGRLRGGQRRIGLGMGTDLYAVVSADGAGDPNNRYLVVWQDGRNGYPDFDVYGRFVNPSGQPQGPSDFVIENPASVQASPALPQSNDWQSGRWLVVWEDDRGTSRDIWGLMFP